MRERAVADRVNVPSVGSYQRAVTGPLNVPRSTVIAPDDEGTYAMASLPSGVLAAVT